MQTYGKSIYGFLGAIAVAIALLMQTGPWTLTMTFHAVGAVAAAFIVWLVPVHPRFASAKSVAFFVVMLMPILIGVFDDGFSLADIVTLVIEVGVILGVKVAGAGSPTITGTYVGPGIHDDVTQRGGVPA